MALLLVSEVEVMVTVAAIAYTAPPYCESTRGVSKPRRERDISPTQEAVYIIIYIWRYGYISGTVARQCTVPHGHFCI